METKMREIKKNTNELLNRLKMDFIIDEYLIQNIVVICYS